MLKFLKSKILLIYLVVLTVVMYLLNLFTPLFCDDWHYAFIFGTQTPIQSIGDIFKSQWAHYFVFNGRFIIHCILQFFDTILGKGVFNVFNALVFGLFLYVVAMLTTKDKGNWYKVVSVAFLLIFLVMTGFKYGFLWMSGSFNYLWVGTALLLFHYLLNKEGFKPWTRVPLFMFSFVCGWSNEAFVVGLGAAYFIYYLFHRKELTPHRVLMLSGFFFGAIFLVFAPASLYRASHSPLRQLSLIDRLINMQNLRLFFVMLIAIIIGLILKRKTVWQWIKKEQLMIGITLLTFAFIVFTGANYEQSRLGIEMFSLVVILRMFNWDKVNTQLVSLCNVAVLVFAGYAISCCFKSNAVCQQELQCVARGDTLILTIQPIKTTSYMRRYTLDYNGVFLTNGIDDAKIYGESDWVPMYYGYKNTFVCFMPKIFIEDLEKNYDKYAQFATLDELPFYAIRLAEGQSIRNVEFVYEPSRYNSLPWPLNRICTKLTNEVEVFQIEPKFTTINGERYAFVPKSHPSQASRLKDIRIIDFPEWSKPVLTSKPEVIRRHFF